MKYKKHQDKEWTKINSFSEIKIEPDILYIFRTEGKHDDYRFCQEFIKENYILSRSSLYDDWKRIGSVAEGTYERKLISCGIEIEFHAISGYYIFYRDNQADKTITCEEMHYQSLMPEKWWKICENLAPDESLFYAKGRIYWEPPREFDNCNRCHKQRSPLVNDPYVSDLYGVKIWKNLCKACENAIADDI